MRTEQILGGMWIAKVNESSRSGLLLQKEISWCLSTDRRFHRSLHGMSQRLLLQFRLVPFSTSPHTAKGRLKHLCALLVPSLWLINYVLPQRGHREAQRFLELGLRPRRPRLTAEGVSTCRRQSRSDGYGGAQNISAPSLRPLCGEN